MEHIEVATVVTGPTGPVVSVRRPKLGFIREVTLLSHRIYSSQFNLRWATIGAFTEDEREAFPFFSTGDAAFVANTITLREDPEVQKVQSMRGRLLVTLVRSEKGVYLLSIVNSMPPKLVTTVTFYERGRVSATGRIDLPPLEFKSVQEIYETIRM